MYVPVSSIGGDLSRSCWELPGLRGKSAFPGTLSMNERNFDVREGATLAGVEASSIDLQ